MIGKVTIQWCPSCQAWGRTKCVSSGVVEGHTEVEHIGMISFNYRRDELMCKICNSVFTRTSAHNCSPDHRWHVLAKLNRLSRPLAA